MLLVLLFGRGKISELMGDMAKGIKSFKKGMAEDPDEEKAEDREAGAGKARTTSRLTSRPRRPRARIARTSA